ncbi:hypothetical protein BJ138DRAFT_1106682 [Hygrophoropsis aurantiaca]|uniref:Uncharacterized protein n=1 Tax=Hygrophoropsis aurantiaca TaxID=72124 RepID=A0ACB7ZTR1_9AGAM|nr:hypothetical protein BJ138DRAFT_1106682 [Hygrophoropsis aurantiaca]
MSKNGHDLTYSFRSPSVEKSALRHGFALICRKNFRGGKRLGVMGLCPVIQFVIRYRPQLAGSLARLLVGRRVIKSRITGTDYEVVTPVSENLSEIRKTFKVLDLRRLETRERSLVLRANGQGTFILMSSRHSFNNEGTDEVIATIRRVISDPTLAVIFSDDNSAIKLLTETVSQSASFAVVYRF